jgi:class 3 adenylate cyclase
VKFSEIINQASTLIQQNGRITYRSLKREFALDDETLEDLKEELLYSRPQVVDDEGRGLIWNEDAANVSSPPSANSAGSQPPASYTPQHLAERIRAEQAAMESRGAANGERKTITALFADLKGSTALIEGLDPEDARAIIDPALQLMMDAVHRYDGYVAQALGDGIFALFGAPIAHEDHPQRALYAALRMQEEMRGYADQSRLKGGIPLQMRVGINTGEVVVRSIRKDDLHTDYVPVGHSTNLAARMEQLATPGSIVISEHTRKLTEGYFDLKALGAAEIKGVEEPLNVYEVLGAGPLRTRFQVTARRGLSRFVGRHSELDQMHRALDQAKAGHGQIVGVMGEPGLGKSRLFHEFKLTSQSGCLVFEAFAVSYGQASPYLPIIELLKNYFQIEPMDDERRRRAKVMGQVLALDKSLEDTLPYLLALLGIADSESSLAQMDAQIRRQRTFAALKKLFLRESLNQPLLFIFEDLHWLDTETQGFLDTLSESVASAQLLLLVNYRPEYRSEWGTKTYYTQLRLTPLGKAEAEELLTFLLGTEASLRGLKALIMERTEGTPFFMEEVVQTLVEEGVLSGERGNYRLETTPTELHLSPTVQGVLAARIDRLSAEEKALLQQLSVIGRQFPVSLMKHVVS